MNTAMQPSLFTLSHSFLFAKNFVLPVMTLSFVPFKKKRNGKSAFSKRFHKVGGVFLSKISLHARRFP